MCDPIVAESLEAGDDGLNDEMPSVHKHEEQDLEWQGNRHRRQHHHAHGEQRTRYDHVDDDERDEEDEADLERCLEFADDKTWNQDAIAQFVDIRGPGLRDSFVKSARSFSRVLLSMNLRIGFIARSRATS